MGYTRIVLNGTTVNATEKQIEVLNVLRDATAGFATLHNYESTTGYTDPKVSTVTINAKATPAKAYSNEKEALQSVSLGDVLPYLEDWKPFVGRKNENNMPSLGEQFHRCMELRLAKCDGRGSESHKKAHEDHSISPYPGTKVWLTKETDEDGIRFVKSVLVFALPVSEKVHKEGVRKDRNRGSKAQVDHAIDMVLNSRKTDLKSYNLLNAERIRINGDSHSF